MTGEPSAGDMLDAGLLAQPDAAAEVRELHGDPRSGPGARAYRITMAGGVSVEVMPERGLDLGSMWWDNQPYAWRSALGPRGGTADPAGTGWVGRFGGGALVTCGLDNIGPARDGLGMHGSHHATPAADVAVTRTPEGDVVVSGVIDSAAVFGRRVTMERRIRVALGRPVIEVRDTIRNHGTTPAPVAVLYHVNLGAPLVLPGTRVEIQAGRSVPRDDAAAAVPWESFPDASESVGESVWEHRELAAGAGGAIEARVTSPHGRVATVAWLTAELPRCVQWIYPTRGGWALGIEPTNAPLFGEDRIGPHAGAPVLAPGATITAGVALTLG